MSAPPSRSKQMINRLAALVELPPPGRPVQEDAIIAEELSRASENIERRVQRREAGFTLATGPENGMYARFGDSIIAAIKELSPATKIQARHSEGSVDNAFLLSRGEAHYAIVQGDVAAAAVTGEDVFSRGQPLSTLRAVGGLFPEAIHIVVRPDSPIKDVADLRGRRVNIGTPTSGTRFDAVAVLAAYGLKPGDLGEAREDSPSAAIERLRRGQIDALFATAAAPERALQAFAAEPGLRLLPLTEAAIERLGQARPGLVRLTLPVNTYPRQKTAVVTAASSALLVTTTSAPSAEVARVADLVFTRMAQKGVGGADVVKVSAETQLRGVTIPLHEGAGRTAPSDER
jgi:TRAP transporter TAXI family solute receptor